MKPNAWTRRDAVAVAAAGLIGVFAALVAYRHDPRRPTALSLDNGWWQQSDQGRYLRAALAFAHGRLDPADQWYLPDYPLLGAPFTWLTHSNPFLIPNLALLAATIILAAALMGWLAPGWRWARPAGALVALASILPHPALKIWVMPWTSTPEAALTLAGLLVTLHLLVRPGSWRMALVLGLCVGALTGFRPIDAVFLAGICGAASCLALLSGRPGWRPALAVVTAGVAGTAAGALPGLVAYLVTNGWRLNEYLQLSFAIGFEWRLLPLRWVVLMLDSRPLFPEGPGLVRVFPWLILGFAGMTACVLSPPARSSRAAHLLVATATAGHIALYLCYRDLHPQGMWRYDNYHYFKWSLVVLALYALALVPLLQARRWPALAAGVVALAVLLPWRAELAPEPGPTLPPQSGNVLHLPPITLGMRDALLVPASGDFTAIFTNEHTLDVGPQQIWYSSTADYRTTPRPGGLLITPLRPLQPGLWKLQFDPGVTLGPGSPSLTHQNLVYGLPCWLARHRPACVTPAIPPGG